MVVVNGLIEIITVVIAGIMKHKAIENTMEVTMEQTSG
jgi:hypothetical protein